ncbi:AAA family ATPase [Actinoplanes sp. CA-131856]
MLVGRDVEVGVLRDLLGRAKNGRGGALVIRGEAGIGKTALLQVVEAEAGGMRVLRATGVESESRLPYAALHQLLFPLTAQIGFQESDLYAVARAVLELIVDAAPVVLVLDDLHWFDKESGDVLAFVARRIGNEAVLAVGATRRLSRESGLPDLEIGRLPGDVAAALLDSHAPNLSAAARQRLLTEAAGNPLALVELPKTAAGSPLDDTLPLNRRLERAFAARAEGTGTAGLLLVLAADTNCDLKRLLAASGASLDDVQRAIDAELIELDGASLRFRHPLMRSAVYQRAPLAARLAAHRALAEQLADFPDRRLWHLASAAVGTDEGLAAELELYAERARARGATMAAVAALRRAGELTDRPGRFTLRAAELASEVGARHEVEQMLAGTDLGREGPVERARLAIVLEVVRYPRYTDPLRRVEELTDIAVAAFEAGSPEVGRQVLWRAASRCFFQATGPETAGARARVAAVLDGDDPLALAILAYTMPEERGRDVLQKINGHSGPEAARFLGSAALVLGDFETSATSLDQAVADARAQGRLGVLTRLLASGNWGRIWLGHWDTARAELVEARLLARETGEAFYAVAAETTLAAIAAMRGDLDQASELIDGVAASPLAAGMRYIQVALAQARGLVHLFRGEASQAYGVLARTFDPADPTYHRYMRWWLVPDLLDAAIGAGRLDEARELIAGLPELAERVGAPILVVTAEYAHHLVDPGGSDIVTRWPLFRARLQLHLGRARRRQGGPARDLLRAARDTFDALGAKPWADAARAELRAAGEHSGQRPEAVREKLSPQELQIAAMAAEGLTNREIAERLFLSHRTIGSHLYRIYPKLGISRRAQLAAVLGVS